MLPTRYLPACLLALLLAVPRLSLAQTGSVGIGTTIPDASAALEIKSTSSGLLPPRMSTVQRDAMGTGSIAAPATGLTIYNTTTNALNVWNGTSWGEAITSATQSQTGPAITFTYKGAAQTYTVPAGVYSLTVDAQGARGGSNYDKTPGGAGGRVVTTLAVTPNETLTIYVGGQGGVAPSPGSGGAGYNGGGQGTSANGGGGGATDLRRSATVPSTSLADRLVVAGGGGGASGYPGGAGGGLSGTAGQGSTTAGQGGTQTGGGASIGPDPNLTGGTLGQGGAGIYTGGGGGYYGGGGGSNGGGGGSGYADASGTNTTMTTGYNAGDGTLTISPGPQYVAAALDGSNVINVPGAWTVSGTNLYRAAGNVGIGTATPGQKLDVTGNANITGTTTVGGSVGIGTTTPAGLLTVQGRGLGAAALDQQQLTGGAGFGAATAWQSFTAGVSGNLTQLDFRISSPTATATSATLSVYAGEGTSGTLLTTQAIAVSYTAGSNQYQQFPLATVVPVVAGRQYTYLLQTTSPAYLGIDVSVATAANPYAGGIYSVNSNQDLLFKTYVAAITRTNILTALAGGNVGIGTASPGQKLDVSGNANISGNTTVGGNSVVGGTLTAGSASITGNTTVGGSVGIGLTSPTQALDVNGGILARSNGAISSQGAYLQWNRSGSEGETWLLNQQGGGGGSIRFGSATTANATTEWGRFDGSGNLGIGTASPGQKLDVNGNANVSGSTYVGGSLALRNSITEKYNFSLAYGGLNLSESNVAAGRIFVQDGGNVGIGTTNPIARLHVSGSASATPNGSGTSYFAATTALRGPEVPNGSGARATAAYFDGGQVWVNSVIVAGALNTTSDRRIKHVLGLSDRAADLALLNQLRITDYTYIDQQANTPGIVKKVIAQEVEQVLPTAVTRSTQAIPNVYEKTTRVNYAQGQLAVTTARPHELPAGGGRMRFYTPANQSLDVDVTVLDAHTVRFASAEAYTGGLFVYGKYVDDFRSVDYDALTTLNVSATQELARQLAALQAENAALRAQAATDRAAATATLETFEARLRRLEAASGGQAQR